MKKGFTLAETLITLSIIGVVASLTIPALVNMIQDYHYKTAYKKAFASATTAWQSALSDNLIVSITVWDDFVANCSNFNTFKSEFVVQQDCGTNTAGCWAVGDMLFNGRGPANGAPAFIDNAGMAWAHYDCGGGGEILFDTNGFTEPNQFGKDRFALMPVIQNGSTGAGLQIKLLPLQDITISNGKCKNTPCYNTTWLTQ